MAERKDRSRAASEHEDPFLARWSRRKHDAREQGTTAPAEAPDADQDAPDADRDVPAAGGSAADAGPEGADLPTDADMPPIESLDADSDFSGFMSPRVSQSLRRMALRKLFGMPGFNVRDGLDDYDEDYRSFASLGDTVTADMKYHAERLRARDAEAEAEGGAAEPPADDGAAPDATTAAVEGDAGEAPDAEHNDAGREAHRDARDDPEEDADDRA